MTQDTSRAARGTENSRKSVKGAESWQELCARRQRQLKPLEWPPLEDPKQASVCAEKPVAASSRASGTMPEPEKAAATSSEPVRRPALDFRPAIAALRRLGQPIEHIVEANNMTTGKEKHGRGL